MDYLDNWSFYDKDLENPPLLERSPTNAIEKEDKVAFKAVFKKIAQGSVKVVWIKRSQIPESTLPENEKSVYYTPVHAFFTSREKELREEVHIVETIKKKFEESRDSVSPKHLVLKMEEITGDDKIHGEYTVEVNYSWTNFEKLLSNPNTSMIERISMGENLLAGLAGLHQADYVHGDMKPENCLIFKDGEKNILKISDFGKAKPFYGQPLYYAGNTRFCPPEAALSKKGDVYGAAMMLIRNFEEPLGEKNTLIEIDPKNRDMAANNGLRGIEKYVIESRDFTIASNPGSIQGKFRRKSMGAALTPISENSVNRAMHAYIDALNKKLKEQNRLPSKQADGLCNLLKQMTLANPKNRLSAQEACSEYKKIFGMAK